MVLVQTAAVEEEVDSQVLGWTPGIVAELSPAQIADVGWLFLLCTTVPVFGSDQEFTFKANL